MFTTLVGGITTNNKEQEEGDNNNNNVGQWAVYTAQSHTYKHPFTDEEQQRDAVGIISGGGTADAGHVEYIENRESAFPFDLIVKSLSIQVEVAQASQETDRVHILNSIVGRNEEDGSINNKPLMSHETYNEVNAALKATFASTVPHLASACRKSHGVWKQFLVALANGTKTINRMEFHFDNDDKGEWTGLTTDRATELVAHLPLNIKWLEIERATAFGRQFMEALIQRVNESLNWQSLLLKNISIVDEDEGQEMGVQLANVVSSNTTLTYLAMNHTNLVGSKNVQEWGNRFMKNKTLTKVSLDGVEVEVVKKLHAMTKERTPELNIISDNWYPAPEEF